MCHPGYHHNGFMEAHALWQIICVYTYTYICIYFIDVFMCIFLYAFLFSIVFLKKPIRFFTVNYSISLHILLSTIRMHFSVT